MNKKVLIISTSMRKNGNSDILAREFEKGAKEANNTVEYINLSDKTINFCKGCLACQNTGKCVINDDAVEIANKMKNSDVVVFATPIYYYEMSGQMKTLLDRMNPLFGSDYSFTDVYMIMTAADGFESAMDIALDGLGGWLSCFSRSKLKGTICGTGVTSVGDVLNEDEMLKSAFDMGKSV